jgi:ferredoxin--NADP+ reductase
MIPEQTTKVLDIQIVARDTKKFVFSKPNNWDYKPGQFLSLKFTDRAFRAYSIASHPDEKNLELIVRLIEGGVGSTVLSKTKIGDEFMFRGAFGHFGLKENRITLPLEQPKTPPSPLNEGELEGEQKNNLIFCATGTGIAPFRSMVLEETKKNSPRPMTLLYGGRNAEDVAYLDEVRSWSDELKICLALSREPDQNVLDSWSEKIRATVINGRITDFLLPENKFFQSKFISKSQFYICGNGDMVMSVRKILLEQDIDKKQIIQERFN